MNIAVELIIENVIVFEIVVLVINVPVTKYESFITKEYVKVVSNANESVTVLENVFDWVDAFNPVDEPECMNESDCMNVFGFVNIFDFVNGLDFVKVFDSINVFDFVNVKDDVLFCIAEHPCQV